MSIVVKVTSGSGDPRLSELLTRQTPSRLGRWGQCQFIVNEAVEKADWWVICHFSSFTHQLEQVCDPSNIVFLSMEPFEWSTPRSFYSQFSHVVLCDPRIKHPGKLSRNAHSWWAGLNVEYQSGHSFLPSINHDYEGLKRLPLPAKIPRISVVTSNLSRLKGHRKRLEFLDALKASSLSKHVDIFGGGHKPVLDKLDAILPYQYHLVLENSRIPDYWSEKLADAFLGYSLPLYSGCTNLRDYFHPDAVVPIDISNPVQALRTIEAVLRGDEFSKRLPLIRESRNQILDDYNIFQLMADVCATRGVSYEHCRVNPPSFFKSPFRLMLEKTKARLASKLF